MGTMKTSSLDRWLVKCRHWDGSTATIYSCPTQAEAERWVRKFNEDRQDTKYYAEEFSPERGFRG